jgi:hypothetical protein
MKKVSTKSKANRDTMRAEYDFSNGVRGKYHEAYHASSNVVVLEPDVAARFANARAVNAALRALLKAAEQARA